MMIEEGGEPLRGKFSVAGEEKILQRLKSLSGIGNDPADLDPITGRENEDFAHRRGTLQAKECLAQVSITERETLADLNRSRLVAYADQQDVHRNLNRSRGPQSAPGLTRCLGHPQEIAVHVHRDISASSAACLGRGITMKAPTRTCVVPFLEG